MEAMLSAEQLLDGYPWERNPARLQMRIAEKEGQEPFGGFDFAGAGKFWIFGDGVISPIGVHVATMTYTGSGWSWEFLIASGSPRTIYKEGSSPVGFWFQDDGPNHAGGRDHDQYFLTVDERGPQWQKFKEAKMSEEAEANRYLDEEYDVAQVHAYNFSRSHADINVSATEMTKLLADFTAGTVGLSDMDMSFKVWLATGDSSYESTEKLDDSTVVQFKLKKEELKVESGILFFRSSLSTLNVSGTAHKIVAKNDLARKALQRTVNKKGITLLHGLA